ncbi:hypothetical protein GIY23_08205 [Allosaccharopolyspora coralli]|uniref:Uncharacterized protein n=1 Tax=Allosaccharopolyspora coralli TaxID=2665642 RepID=A0A5Q3QL51_9PSEU|nr:hypothetical protein GIY23_08205 [Allosaccharopolyspora coralli]
MQTSTWPRPVGTPRELPPCRSRRDCRSLPAGSPAGTPGSLSYRPVGLIEVGTGAHGQRGTMALR